MKTRIEILEQMHDEALTAIVDAEISIKILSRMIITTPNDDKANASLMAQRNKRDNLERNMGIVEEMIAEEKKKAQKDNPGIATVK